MGKNENKNKEAMDVAIAEMEAKYGLGMVLNEETLGKNVEWISTGCYSIDKLLGKGIPRGRLIEVYGAPSSGKTAMALFIGGQIQKTGHRIAFIDVEQAYDGEWAAKLGVSMSPDKMTVAQPTTIEETFDIIKAFVATNQIDLIIVDSVDAMIPARELEDGAMEKDTIGLKARILGKYVRALSSTAAKSKTSVIFINQTRANVGVMYGEKEITPGGKALKYYTSIRVSVTKGERFMQGSEQIGNGVKLTTKKNKVSNPFRTAELHVYYESGIDLMQDTLDACLDKEIITRKGNTYSYEDTKLGVGRDAAKHFLRENKEVYDSIQKQLKDTDTKVDSSAKEDVGEEGE